MKGKKYHTKGDKALKKLITKFSAAAAGLALMITALNVNTACMFVMHQPKLPKGAEKLIKYQ